MMTALLVSACSEMKSTFNANGSNGSASASSGITVASAAQIGERVMVSSSRSGEIISYVWQIRNELGVDITPRCAPSRTAPNLECFFYETGRVDVLLQASMRDGSTKYFKDGLEVSDSPFGMDQPPTVDLTLTQAAASARLTSLLDRMDDVPQFYSNQAIAFDLGASVDDKAGSLTYKVSIGGVSPATYTSAQFNHTFSLIGTYGVTVEVRDSAGNVGRKVFNLLVTCDASAVRQVVTGISAVYLGFGNFWTFNVNHSRPRATAPFSYQWDFDGDGIFDTDWEAAPAVNSNKLTTMRGKREVTVLVKDNACNFVANYTQILNFDAMPKLTPVVVGVTDASSFTNGWTRHYIQAELTAGANNSSLVGIHKDADASAADYIAMKEAGHAIPNIANCEYSPSAGTFQMRGLNFYDTPSREGMRHGLAIDINNMPKNLSVGELIASSTANLKQAAYYTDKAGDAQSQLVYRKSAQTCQLQVNVMRLPDGVVPCSPGEPAVVMPAYRIYGTFSCPDLEAGNAAQMSLQKGAFACEFAITDMCVGGGGGGGGGIDPILQ